MQAIDPSFMKFELKIEKTEAKVAMLQSVLCKDRSKEEMKGIESRASHSGASNANRKQGGRATRDSDVFFTLNERDSKG